MSALDDLRDRTPTSRHAWLDYLVANLPPQDQDEPPIASGSRPGSAW